MHRAAVRTTLSHGRLDLRGPAYRYLSTTPCARDDSSTQPPRSNSRQRSAAAASELSSLNRSSSSGASAVDARSLGVSLGSRGGAAGGPNMINLRSLNGRFASARGRGRGGGLRARGRGRGGRGGRGSRGGGRGRGRSNDDNRPKKTAKEDPPWTMEEQDAIERADEVATPFTPSLTLESLAGHGPALATDCSLGKMETGMRNMRILGGGKPFDPSGPYSAPDDRVRRYYQEKKPIFFDDVEEKNWMRSIVGNVQLRPPRDNTKTAILQASIQGKYSAPEFVASNDTLGTTTNYHTREATYSARHAAEFDAKLRSLLPSGAAKGPPKPETKTKTA